MSFRTRSCDFISSLDIIPSCNPIIRNALSVHRRCLKAGNIGNSRIVITVGLFATKMKFNVILLYYYYIILTKVFGVNVNLCTITIRVYIIIFNVTLKFVNISDNISYLVQLTNSIIFVNYILLYIIIYMIWNDIIW